MNIIKEIVPKSSLQCLKSLMLIKYSYNKYQSINDFFNVHTREEILKDLFNINYSYEMINMRYDDACNMMKDNDFFVLSYKINDSYNLKISEKIQIFYYDERFEINGNKLFRWDYPEKISCLGNRFDYGDEEIMSDFISLNMISYYLKYCLGHKNIKQWTLNNIVSTNTGYIVNDVLSIVLDEHISFFHDDRHTYISDTWWNTNEEIINDLSNMSPAEFGVKYKAFWC